MIKHGYLGYVFTKGQGYYCTGGRGKYGKQIVLALAEAGAKVYTASRIIKSNEEYAESLKDKGLDVEAAQVDQGEGKGILDFKDFVIGKEGKVNVLVNNAVVRVMKNQWHCTLESFD